MNISKDARERLTQFSEGLRLVAYPDPGTGGAPWTIGYGHTKGVRKGDKCTGKQAEDFLIEDLKEAENAVSKHVKVSISQGQFDALVDFVFNVGEPNFKSSTLLRKLNAQDYEGAALQFSKWVYAGGKTLPGLVKRRAAETAWFLQEDKA